MSRIFRIHPAIGVARVGNADRDAFFIGPEAPGIPANFDVASGEFRPFKKNGLIRPQAAQFRIWEYERLADGSLRPKEEAYVGANGVVAIEWIVHLANRKSAFFEFQGPLGSTNDFETNALRNADVPQETREYRLVLDTGARSISGSNAGPVALANMSSGTREGIPDIGELRTDEVGRLRVLGGRGLTLQKSANVSHYANNDGWFDDVGDGPVAAMITVLGSTGLEVVSAEGAWVIVGPPDFAPAIKNVVTLFDTMVDVAVRELPKVAALATDGTVQELETQRADWAKTGKSFSDYTPSFTKEIAPLLERAFMMTFVHSPTPSSAFHTTIDPSMWTLLSSDERVRRDVFGRLRDPDGKNPSAALMPRGFGDEFVEEDDDPANTARRLNPRRFLSLTRIQYAVMRQWMMGKFLRDGDAPHRPSNVEVTPEGSDRAALENCVGGPFFPGIEVGWLVRKREIYSAPFRINLGAKVGPLTIGPGFLTQQMAVPWHADFRDCKRERLTDPTTGKTTTAMWCAAQRPDDVYPENDPNEQAPWIRPPYFNADDDSPDRYAEMKDNWFKLGFVAKFVGKIWVETERG